MNETEDPRRPRTVVYDEAASQDLDDAYNWYASRGAETKARELVMAVQAKVREIAEAPEVFPCHRRRQWARRARLLDWPHTLIFTVLDDGRVVILAVAHGKRRPTYWAKRRPK